jgi:RecA/RadA recombinase
MKSEKKQTAVSVMGYPTGSDLLDLVVGAGISDGYPAGRIINLVGDKSTGKTFLACEIVAAAFHKAKADGVPFSWEYDDCESGFTFDTKAMYGFEIMPEKEELRRRSQTVEDLYNNVRDFIEGLRPGARGVYIVDSLDGLTSDEGEKRVDARFSAFQKGKEFKEGSYMMAKAKFLSQEFFPSVAELLEKSQALLVVISQVRSNLDPTSYEKNVRAGGRAMDFYCHTVLWLSQRSKITKRERAVGVVIHAQAKKSKTYRPYRAAIVSLLFDYGLDNTGSNLDFLFDLRTPKTAILTGADAIVWDPGEEKTLPNLTAFLDEHKAMAECKKAVGDKGFKRGAITEWIAAHAELSTAYQERFGTTMTRDELIEFIESKGLQAELKKRTVAKWEAIEQSIKTARVPKYASA